MQKYRGVNLRCLRKRDKQDIRERGKEDMKVTDKQIKSIIAYVLKNKVELVNLLDYFDYRDIENGILKIPAGIVNTFLKNKVMNVSQVREYVNDYKVGFENDCIFLDARINGKKLGPIAAKYMINIADVRFGVDGCRIYGTFHEDVQSLGNKVQSVALKAAMSGSTALQRVINIVGCNFVYVDGRNIMIDLTGVEAVRKISSAVELNYMGCRDGYMKFNITYLGGN